MNKVATAVREKVKEDGSARELLLRSASELMIDLGTHDVSLHAIAKRAGVTAPLVKYHFGGKEGLLLALVERDTARSLTQLEELSAMTIDPVAKLKIHITGIIRTYARYPYLNGLLNQLLRDTQSTASEEIKDVFVQPLISAQRAIIEQGVASGVFKPIDPDALYFIIVGACQYLFASRMAFRNIMNGVSADDQFVRRYPSTVVDIIISGLLERPLSA